ncbi:MAG TPA: glutamate ABC transporter substrate-binding protein [Acidimicrobiales bacterium]
MNARRAAALAIAGLTVVGAGCARWSNDVSGSAVEALRDPTTTSAAPTATAPGTTTTTAAGSVCDELDKATTFPPLDPMPTPAQLKASATGSLRRIVDRGYLVAGVDENTLLLGYRDPLTGVLEGYEIDLLHAISTALFGRPGNIQFKTVTTAQKVDLVAAGEVDLTVSAVSITCGRRTGKQGVEFSAPYFQTTQRVMVRDSSTIRSLADLDGKWVCVTRGSTSLGVIKEQAPDVKPYVVDTRTECLAALQTGRADAIFTHETFLWGFQVQDRDTRILPDALSEQLYGVAVNKSDVDLVRFVNGVIEKQRTGGGFQKAYDRQFKDCDLCAPIADKVPDAVPVPDPDFSRRA